jgi:phosphoserine phosphatase
VTEYLVVFDVDSTLIEDEVIELLADVAGKRAEVAAVTDRAMAGELDFAESLIQRVATLEGLPETVFEDVQARIRITMGAKETISAIQAAGGKVGAVSGGFIQLLTPLSKTLNLDYARANELEVRNGLLTGKVLGKIIDRTAKAEALAEWAAESGLSRTVAVGDGANDLSMMATAELGVAFNAKPIVREKADVILEGNDLRGLLKILEI